MPVLGHRLAPHIERAMAVRDSAILSRRPTKQASERTCGAPGCIGGWTPPWKKRHRPIFEQEWGCGTRCLAKLVAAAVRRESFDGSQAQRDEPHRHRVPLGLVLLAQGWITHPQLRAALEAQRAGGRGRIGDWLQQSCGLEEERIARGLGVQWNCPVLATTSFSPTAMALVMPRRLVAEFGLVPVRVAGSSLLYLAFEEQMDAVTALSVERMSGLKVESGLLAASDFASARQGVLEAEAIPVQMKLVPDRDGLTAAIVRVLEQRQPLASRMVRVHQYYWLRMWLESGAMAGVGDLPTSTEDVEDYLFLIGNR
jgi:hypothetical protein